MVIFFCFHFFWWKCFWRVSKNFFFTISLFQLKNWTKIDKFESNVKMLATSDVNVVSWFEQFLAAKREFFVMFNKIVTREFQTTVYRSKGTRFRKKLKDVSVCGSDAPVWTIFSIWWFYLMKIKSAIQHRDISFMMNLLYQFATRRCSISQKYQLRSKATPLVSMQHMLCLCMYVCLRLHLKRLRFFLSFHFLW